MDRSKIVTYYNTLRHLRFVQLAYRGRLFVRNFFPVKNEWNNKLNVVSNDLNLEVPLIAEEMFCRNGKTFSFLNISHSFTGKIDWNWLGYGRLWTYNLNYFEFLHQKDYSKDTGISLIDDFIEQLPTCTIGLEPYPLSLRCTNWIRFFVKYKIKNPGYDAVLFQQLNLLTRKLEYHLLGNHLLENGFTLLFGAYYFDNEYFYKQAKRILLPELKEQTLADGANFELSPMYHCIILLRVLDCYNLVKSNPFFHNELLSFFSEKSSLMLGWLRAVVFKNGDIPLFNDSAFRVAPAPAILFDYAGQLGLHVADVKMKESGYRKLYSNKFESVIDVAKVGPDYQPGHAHADTLNFELHVNNRAVIVDAGTSTYEVNETRFYERSTSAHNTVAIDGTNSSEVWAGHRVGNRAEVELVEDSYNRLTASHNGYKSKGLKHVRSFEISDQSFIIKDEIAASAVAYLHFHPCERIEMQNGEIVGPDYKISFIGADSIKLFGSYYAPEFNKKIPSTGVQINFKNKLYTIFK